VPCLQIEEAGIQESSVGSEFLIDKVEQDRRADIVKGVCTSYCGVDWMNRHFEKLDNTIKETNEMTANATQIMLDAWQKGIKDKTNPFDEPNA
jgi:hydroxylamine dehydrogenase